MRGQLARQPRHPADRPAQHGHSDPGRPRAPAANAAAHTIAAGVATPAASGPAEPAVPRRAPRAARHTSPATSRNALNQRRRSVASASASVGRVRAAACAAMYAEPTAVGSAVPIPTITGTDPARYAIDPGTTPASANAPSSHRPNHCPGSAASPVATTARNQGLAEHEPAQLPRSRAHRPQQGHLALPLLDAEPEQCRPPRTR
ncbi:hypothetical protein [Streptomyces sp. KL116D]|uniref:hypothetical protein n=1 Tax=Streptomyces sp. KL116D TaxID=3045152 RepID=UPI0035563583